MIKELIKNFIKTRWLYLLLTGKKDELTSDEKVSEIVKRDFTLQMIVSFITIFTILGCEIHFSIETAVISLTMSFLLHFLFNLVFYDEKAREFAKQFVTGSIITLPLK